METLKLETRRIRLRPVEKADIPLLHRWRNEGRYLSLCCVRRDPVELEKITAEVERDCTRKLPLEFVIELTESGGTIGLISATNLNLVDGNAFVSIYLDERCEGRGYGGEAMIVFLNYLFKSSPLHKIYFEAFEYNTNSVAMMQDAYLVKEGEFREHRLFNGRRWTLVRFATYRNSLEKLEKLLSRL